MSQSTSVEKRSQYSTFSSSHKTKQRYFIAMQRMKHSFYWTNCIQYFTVTQLFSLLKQNRTKQKKATDLTNCTYKTTFFFNRCSFILQKCSCKNRSNICSKQNQTKTKISTTQQLRFLPLTSLTWCCCRALFLLLQNQLFKLINVQKYSIFTAKQNKKTQNTDFLPTSRTDASKHFFLLRICTYTREYQLKNVMFFQPQVLFK